MKFPSRRQLHHYVQFLFSDVQDFVNLWFRDNSLKVLKCLDNICGFEKKISK